MSRLSNPSWPDGPDSCPFVSVVMPVKDEAPFIEPIVNELLGQDYDQDRFEVLVVDGESSDRTREIVAALQADHPNLRLYRNPKQLSSAGRNIGVDHARGDLIVVVDGHCELRNRHFLRDLADAFRRSGADCLGRPQPLKFKAAGALQRAIAAARSSRLGHHVESCVYETGERFVRPQSVAVAYRRSVFERVGLFDETFDACEDVEFNHRVDREGLRCFFTPKIQVHYQPRSSLRALYLQMVRYGRGRARLLRKYPKTFSVLGFVPAAFVLGLMIGPIAAWLSPELATDFAATLLLYLILIATASASLVQQTGDVRLVPFLFIVFPTIHVGAGVGLLEEWAQGLFRRQRASVPAAGLSCAVPRVGVEGSPVP